MEIQGQCHCGNIAFTLQTSVPDADIELRACDCSFCRAHGAKAWSDPNGRTEILVQNNAKLQRYVFALNTSEFLLCSNCGVYVASVLTDTGKSWSTVNMRLTRLRDKTAASVSYDSESAEERIQRRQNGWTPTKVVYAT
jgi:hypothetical protein